MLVVVLEVKEGNGGGGRPVQRTIRRLPTHLKGLPEEAFLEAGETMKRGSGRRSQPLGFKDAPAGPGSSQGHVSAATSTTPSVQVPVEAVCCSGGHLQRRVPHLSPRMASCPAQSSQRARHQAPHTSDSCLCRPVPAPSPPQHRPHRVPSPGEHTAATALQTHPESPCSQPQQQQPGAPAEGPREQMWPELASGCHSAFKRTDTSGCPAGRVCHSSSQGHEFKLHVGRLKKTGEGEAIVTPTQQ